MSTELPDVPETGQQLEDYVAALFLAAEHFVEKNVTEPNVLELDIVATDYEMDPPRVIPAEAKSGGWGYGDLFKVAGWMRYLRIGEGAFFCQGAGDKNLDHVREVFEPLEMVIVDLEDFANSLGKFTAEGLPPIEHPDEIEHWRWVHQIERLLAQELIAVARGGDTEGPKAVLQYHRLVNDGIFFERTITGRIQKLYAAYQSHPRLAVSCAREMDGHAFNPDVFFWQRSDRITEAIRDGEHVLIQAAFYAEHRAKLYRGMGWRNSVEMAAVMVLPVIPFLCLVWFNVTKSAPCGAYCAISAVAMLALMRCRKKEYTTHSIHTR
jgi:hypothetical protein